MWDFFSAETLISASSIPQCSGGVVVVTLLHSTQSGVRNTNMTFYYVEQVPSRVDEKLKLNKTECAHTHLHKSNKNK